MILEELYIGSKTSKQEVDIKETSIVRLYKTPYFNDADKVLSDTTYTIKLPQTERNKAIMKYLHEADMNTDFPYTYHYADYIVEGMQIIKNGEVKILGDFEIQIVYGINREKYLPLKDIKLNEIPRDGMLIGNDWIIDWTKDTMQPSSSSRYKYLEYISGERESDAYIFTDNTDPNNPKNIVQPAILPDEPILSNMKEMTMHPYIAFENIFTLIRYYLDYGVSIFDKLIAKSSSKGLILGGRESNKEVTFYNYFLNNNTTPYTGYQLPMEMLIDPYNILVFFGEIDLSPEYVYTWQQMTYDHYSKIFQHGVYYVILYPTAQNVNGVQYRLDNVWIREVNNTIEQYVYSGLSISKSYNSFHINLQTTGISYPLTVSIQLDLSVQDTMPQLRLLAYKSFSEPTLMNGNGNGVLIPYVSHENGKYVYDTTITFDITEEQKDYFFTIGDTTSRTFTIDSGGTLKFSYVIKNCIFAIPYRESNVDIPAKGHYDCIKNLPKISCLDFIQQVMIQTGAFMLYDENGDIDFTFLEDFKDNLDNGNVYNWSGKISNSRNSKYQFNSNAKKNWIKFNNSDKLTYTAKDYVEVQDDTISLERDLYKIDFNLAEKSTGGISEFTLYKQTVKESKDTDNNVTKAFTNEYNEKETVVVADIDGVAYNEPCLPNESESNLKIYAAAYEGTKISIGVFLSYPNDFIDSFNTYNTLFSVGDEIGIFFNNGYNYTTTITSIDYVNKEIVVADYVSLNLSQIRIKPVLKGFIATDYSIYQKLINRPIVKEVDVLLDFYESANIDFTKPIYIEEWGKYCMLLELTAPNKGLCTATLLLINQTL